MLHLIKIDSMKSNFYNIVAALSALAVAVGAISCKKVIDYSACAEPEIVLPVEEIHPDLNRVDNTPVVCVIFSEAGLKQVNIYIARGEQESLLQTFDSFSNPHQHSVKAEPEWTEDITGIRIEALDKAGKRTQATMDVIVTPILPAPVIVFSQEKILIDEFKGDNPSIETGFTVTSSNTLASVSVKLFRTSGSMEIPLTPALKPSQSEYSFTQTIDYMEGDRALQVAATDANGKLHIETLPVQYIPAPAPIITPTGTTTGDAVCVSHDQSLDFTMNVTAEVDIALISVYAISKSELGAEVATLIGEQSYLGAEDHNVDYSYTVKSFDQSWYELRFVATDALNHKSTLSVGTLVDFRIAENILVGSQYNAKEALEVEEYPGQKAYCFFSLKDMKTYSLFDFYDMEQRRNIDFFYFAWNSDGKVTGTRLMRSNEDRSGQDAEGYLKYIDPEDPSKNIPELGTGTQWASSRNVTQIRKLNASQCPLHFTYENATVSDLLSPQCLNYLAQPKQSYDWIDFVAGDSFIFRTGTLSTTPDCVGVMKIEYVKGSKNDFGKAPVYIVVSIKVQSKELSAE